jgi:ADP-heptose:LPS heptosyltransferase
MAPALHIRFRQKMNQLSHRLLSKLFPLKMDGSTIPKESIQRILVVRINYRIGNILFTTPLLNALSKEFPDAKIDVMIGAPFITSLIEEMPNVNRVYSFPRELLKHPLKVLKFKKELKENNYDLLVSPSLHSSSDTFFTFLVSATYKLGFYSPDVFSPLTHGIAFPSTIEHEALKPLALMSAFGREVNDFDHFMNLQLTKEEKKRAILKKGDAITIGIFRDARNEKKIKDDWWRELLVALKKLQPHITIIDILDPNNQTALNENMETLSEKSLRVLAIKISQLDAFICGDTGPMHLASASLTPTIALFKTTSPTLYGTLGEKDLSLQMQGKNIKEIALEIDKHLKRVHHR